MAQDRNEYAREWKRRNPEKVLARRAAERVRLLTDPEWAAKKRAACMDAIRKRPAMQMIRAAKERSRLHGTPFDLKESDIIVTPHCPCCDVAMVRGISRWRSPSLDRIDPTRGYYADNVWVICGKCNTIKQDATPARLRLIADAVEAKLATC